MKPSRRILAAAVPALAALAAAPGAHAAMFTPPLKPCYVAVDPAHRETLATWAIGFTPNADVSVTVGKVTKDGLASARGVVDLSQTAAPYRERGQAPFSVKVTELANPLNTVTATSWVTALSVRLRPADAPTSARVRFRGRGFTADHPIWGHYLFRDHVKRTVKLAARPEGACGTFSVRRRQFPMRHPRPGVWTLQVDQQRRWSAHPNSVSVPVFITVRPIARGG